MTKPDILGGALAISLGLLWAATCHSENRLLRGDEIDSIRGAQTAPPCDTRFYSYSCKQITGGGNVDSCLDFNQNDCAGACSYCDGARMTDFCDCQPALNVLGCATKPSPFGDTCGKKWTTVCHMVGTQCQCYGGGGASGGSTDCQVVNIASYKTGCDTPQ